MAASQIKVVFKKDQMQALLIDEAGEVSQDIMRRGRAVENEAKRLCPVDTGVLRSSIRTGFESGPRGGIAHVGTNVAYALIVHDGRRGFSARPGKVLAWERGGKWHYAKSVRAVKGVPFLADALSAAAA